MGATAVKLTVDQFLALPERPEVKRELVDGEVVEVSSGGPVHETVKSNFLAELIVYLRSARRGAKAFSETMYWLSDQDSPIPDVSVVLSGRLDPERTGKTRVVPDIAVEVVSSESATALRRKIKLYLEHGARAVWVAYPEFHLILIHDRNGIRELTGDQTLEDQELLPGFSVPVSAFFEGID